MRILIDGDACPVKSIIIEIAEKYDIGVTLVYSTSHHGNITFVGNIEKIMVDNESQAADMAIINKAVQNDIVVTGDYGLASLILGKKAFAISFNGFIYDDKNIDKLLYERHLGMAIRKSGGRLKGPSKRSKEDDLKFKASLEAVILKNLKDI